MTNICTEQFSYFQETIFEQLLFIHVVIFCGVLLDLYLMNCGNEKQCVVEIYYLDI